MKPFKPFTGDKRPATTTNTATSGYKTAGNNWIDKQEVLQYMRIAERTLQKWRSNGTIPFYRIGGRIYYREGDLEEVMQKNKRIGVERRGKQQEEGGRQER